MSSAVMGRFRNWMGAGLLASLTGCASLGGNADAGRTPPATSTPQATAHATPEPAPRSTPEPRKPAKRIAPTRLQPSAPPPVDITPPPPSLQPIGLNEEALQKLLGQPSTIRDETPAKVLSFRRSGCALSLTLYPDVETRTFRTLSYEVTSDDHDERTAKLCHARFGLPADGADVAARR